MPSDGPAGGGSKFFVAAVYDRRFFLDQKLALIPIRNFGTHAAPLQPPAYPVPLGHRIWTASFCGSEGKSNGRWDWRQLENGCALGALEKAREQRLVHRQH